MLKKLQESDIKLLNIFRAVVNCGGFAPAQVELNTSQSAISTAIADLEVRIGYRLCERGRSGFRLTHEGQVVFDAFERVHSAIHHCAEEINDGLGGVVGQLSIGINDNLVTHPNLKLPEALSRFHRTAPEVDVRIHVGGLTELESKTLDRSLDLAVGYFPVAVAGLEYSLVISERHQLYCSDQSSLYKIPDAEISDSDLADAEFVSRGAMDASGVIHDELEAHSRAESLNMEGLLLLILSGQYIGYLPDHYAAKWVSEGRLRSIQPNKIFQEYELSLAVPKGALSRKASLFIQELRLSIGRKEVKAKKP